MWIQDGVQLLLALLVALVAVFGESVDLRLSPDLEHAPFLHGVASHDPLEDAVLLWTRVDDDTVRVVEWALWDPLAENASVANPFRRGFKEVSPDSDMTVTVEAVGLESGKRYVYQFFTQDDRYSIVGRTKTIAAQTNLVSMAVMSCTSLWSGYFNFYRKVATDDSIDVVVHVGDFIYPDIDRQEQIRIPRGLCEYAWYGDFVDGLPQENSDPFLAQHVGELNCSEGIRNDLEDYRWVHSLYMLDPDFRAARAAHPFIVTLDNHDITYRDSTPYNGSRQAATEWVPMRQTVAQSETRPDFIDNLRTFRFGDGLVDLIMLDTYTYADWAGGETSLLGEGQAEWLRQTLQNSSSLATWRVLGTARTFMPMTLNHAARPLMLVAFLLFLISLLFFVTCVSTEMYLSKQRVSTAGTFELSSRESEQGSQFSADSDNVPVESMQDKVEADDRILSYFAKLKLSHREAPKPLRYCTACGGCCVAALLLIAVCFGFVLFSALASKDELVVLDPHNTSWNDHPLDRLAVFEALDDSGASQNNVWAAGNMHTVSQIGNNFPMVSKRRCLIANALVFHSTDVCC